MPRSIRDEKVEQVIAKTLEEMPEDETHWSTRSLAKQVRISPASAGRIRSAFGLQPLSPPIRHRTRTRHQRLSDGLEPGPDVLAFLKTADRILASLVRRWQRISDTGH